MNIRQAARWAERKECLYSANKYTGELMYMYAAYDISTHEVLAIGSHEKCVAAMRHGARLEALVDVVEGMDESEGESMCVPDPSEAREWM